ncbi:helix-turn-helix domain-containing protein [Streptomyces sp. NPDC089799]|uniref:MarR family transcriptional regulator n=1 Tax=Streptomyces sp. NPDC089799 TaxID=3155066 RepID=UPI003426F0A5
MGHTYLMEGSGSGSDRRSEWTFLTNHARVLLAIARDPGVRLREVALTCGVTERTVQGIVADLEEAGYLTRSRAEDGRRNHYTIVPGSLFRHPAEAGHEIAGLLELFRAPHGTEQDGT